MAYDGRCFVSLFYWKRLSGYHLHHCHPKATEVSTLLRHVEHLFFSSGSLETEELVSFHYGDNNI